jgi:adenylate cyclase
VALRNIFQNAVNVNLRRTIASVTFAIILIGAVVWITQTEPLDSASDIDVDLLHWIREVFWPQNLNAFDSPTVVIAIDEATHNDAALSGLPKVMWTPQIAKVQNAVLDAGATVFAWDVILPTSAATYVADDQYDRPLLVSLFQRGRQGGKILLGWVSFADRPIRPHASFETAIGRANVRSLMATPDPDGVVRSMPLVWSAIDTVTGDPITRASISLELASRLLGEPVKINENAEPHLSGKAIPLNEFGSLQLNFDTSKGAIPSFSFADLLSCAESGQQDYFERYFKGKAVLLGLVTDLEDRKLASNRFVNRADLSGAAAPCTEGFEFSSSLVRSTMPGVYLHATTVNNLVLDNALQSVGPQTRLLLIVAFCIVMTIQAMTLRPQRSWLLAFAFTILWVFVALVSFRNTFVVPLSQPIIAGMICLAGSISYRYITTDRERSLIRESFAQYLDPVIIESQLEHGNVPQVGGELREMTCLFCDMAGFTKISEQLTPEELVKILNTYFDIADEEVSKAQGIVVNYIGDAVMAVFGAPFEDPDHARHAVEAAISTQKRLNENQEILGQERGFEFRVRFGINTGEMTVGNIGSRRRVSYTVMGDAVNVAARLESGNKQYHTGTLVGERTWELSKDDFEWQQIDLVRVVGRETPIAVYMPLGRTDEVSPERISRKMLYEQALALKVSGNLRDSLEQFQLLSNQGDGVSAAMVGHIVRILKENAQDERDGVTVLQSK